MTRYFRFVVLGLMVFLTTCLPASAQEQPVAPQALPEDVASVDAIMSAVYDVISGGKDEARDWDRFRSLFHPDAKLIPSGCNPAGQCEARYWSIDQYIEIAGPTLISRGFFETETHRVEERFGNIAHIFSTYDSRWLPEDPEPFQRGINSFQLFNDGNRWWVVNIFWQGETNDTPIPDKYGG